MAPTATVASGDTNAAPAAVKGASRIQPDPEVVQYPKFDKDPVTPEEVFARAAQVSELLHEDEAIRDRGNVVPYRQVQLLKDAGLVTILGPRSAGGAGLTWKEAYEVIRIIARGDGSLGQLIGYHYLWSWAGALVGTDEQRTRFEEWITKNKYFVGGAVNPRDADLKVQQDPNDADKLVFNGKKTFSTGSKISDVTILEGSLPEGGHVFAAVLSKQAGIVYGDEWVDTLGMRGTQSGGISITNVVVSWSDALGFVNKQFQPIGAYNTLNLPQIQLVFTSFYLGIAEGALARAAAYTKANTRGWPYQPNPVARGTDEAYIQIGYGDLQAKLWATASFIESVFAEASAILHTAPRQQVTEEQRAKFAVRVAAAKINAVVHTSDLAKQTHLPLLDLKRFIAAVQASLSDDLAPDEQFLTESEEPETDSPKSGTGFISTLDDTLDAALGGGVPVGCITEFAGESGAGKTQFLLSLCLAVQLSSPRGLGKKALYISTESSLATQRLAQILENNEVLKAGDNGDKPSLDNILSTATPDLESQDHILEYQVPVLLERYDIGLVVMDSVAANYRAEFELKGSRGSNMAARSAQLVRLGAMLRDIARRRGIAVVVANQVADRFHSAPSRPLLLHRPGPPESLLASRSGQMPPPPTFSSTPSSSIPFPPSDDGPPAPLVLLLDHQQRWFSGWGDEPRASRSLKTPSLGLVWSTQIACRVALLKRPVYGRPRRIAAPLDAEADEDTGPTLRSWRRWMKVVFAPQAPASGQGVTDAIEFEVNLAGLRAKEKGEVV